MQIQVHSEETPVKEHLLQHVTRMVSVKLGSLKSRIDEVLVTIENLQPSPDVAMKRCRVEARLDQRCNLIAENLAPEAPAAISSALARIQEAVYTGVPFAY